MDHRTHDHTDIGMVHTVSPGRWGTYNGLELHNLIGS